MKPLILLLLFGSFTVIGQDSTHVSPSKIIKYDWHYGCTCGYDAEFPGGTKAFHTYLQENLNFTGIPRFNENTHKRLYITFTVTEYGDIENLEIHDLKNKEVIREVERVFYQMPIWRPAEIRCENVKTRVRLPILIDWREG